MTSLDHSLTPPVSTTADRTALADRNRSLGRYLVLIAIAMVLLVPLMYYTGSVLCRALGIGFNPGDGTSELTGTPTGRTVRAILTADSRRVPGIHFVCDDRLQVIPVGEKAQTTFHIRNDSGQVMHIRPIHAVSPPSAARAFDMTVCFCFNDMTLQPGEAHSFPVVYFFKADMDARVHEAIVSYTLEPISPEEMRPVTNELPKP